MNRTALSLLTAGLVIAAAFPASAFWVEPGWRGGVAGDAVGAAAGASASSAAVPSAAPMTTSASNPAEPNWSVKPSTTQAKSPATQTAATNAAADQCAMGLPADSKMIYDASVRNMKSVDTLRDTVVAQTRSLVLAGKISEAAARPAAEKAGTCLRMLANQ